MVRAPQSPLSSEEHAGHGYYSGHASDDLVALEKRLIGGPQVPLPDIGRDERDYFSSGDSEDLVTFEKKLLAKQRVRTDDDPWLGLALSGGGIRSATFCLGGLQALAQQNLLRFFDYLSSVSGGGYVACALQWWWSTPNGSFGANYKDFPYGHRFGAELDPKKRITDSILLYLRWHGKYLTPGDGITIWSAIAVVLRTICLNFFVWVGIGTLAFYSVIKVGQAIDDTYVANQQQEAERKGERVEDPRGAPAWVMNPFPGVIVAHWYNDRNCGEEPLSTAHRLSVERKDGGGTSTVTGVGPAGIHGCYLTYPLGLVPFPWTAYAMALFFTVFAMALSLMSWISDPDVVVRSLIKRLFWPVTGLALSIALILSALIVYHYLGQFLAHELWELLLVGGLSISALILLTSVLFLITASNYVWRRRFEVAAGALFVPAILCLALGSVPLLPYYLLNKGGPTLAVLWGVISALSGLGSAVYGHTTSTNGKAANTVTSLVAAVASLVFLYSTFVLAYLLAQLAINTNELVSVEGNSANILRATILSLSGVGLVMLFATNINYVGLHRFYRDRLMETFMPSLEVISSPQVTYSREADLLTLNELWPRKPSTQSLRREIPYPIINTNVILVNETDAKLRLRGGSSFMLTPWLLGSDATGWENTDRHFKKHGSLTLASAMAVSGAAANSNAAYIGAGVTRNRIVSVVMSLLNTRLGLWIGTPDGRDPQVIDHKPTHYNPGLKYGLLRYGYQRSASYSELSDGGHFENLGIYELIRRQVKIALVMDSEADPSTTMAALVSATKRIEDDFGATIDLENCMTNLLSKDLVAFPPNLRWVERPYFIARIRYKNGECGRLIYVKAALLTKLSFVARGYKAQNEDFPHESTVDQFFEPDQFEVYRELGYKSVQIAIKNLRLESYITRVQRYCRRKAGRQRTQS